MDFKERLKTPGLVEGEDYPQILALLHVLHPNAGEPKIKVARNKQHNSYFYLNGHVWVPFSYLKALGILPSQKKLVHAAFRRAVQRQVRTVRRKFKATKDEHVDHVVPFSQLLRNFLAGENIEELAVATSGTYLKDKVLEEKWKAYHKKHAVLRICSAQENLAKGNSITVHPISDFWAVQTDIRALQKNRIITVEDIESFEQIEPILGKKANLFYTAYLKYCLMP